MSGKRCTGIAAAILVLVIIFYLLHRADRSVRTQSVGLNTAASATPVGTWKAGAGPIFQLRPDGTGRSYDPLLPQVGVDYFEWSCDGTALTIRFPPRRGIVRLLTFWSDVATDTFAVDELTPDSMVLSDATSARFAFTPTTDPVLDASP